MAYDDEKGKQLETRAADGGMMPHAAMNAGDALNMIEDGQFSADLHEQLVDLAATMSDQAAMTGKKVKGKVTITLDFENEGGVFRAVGKFAVKKPELPRRPTLLWTNERNAFQRSQPRQGGFFGVREVEVPKGDVRVIS